MNKQKFRFGLIIFMFLIFPIIMNYFSPYIIIDAIAQGIIAGSFITFVSMFIGSLFFGRFWCGWLCPAGGLQEICSKRKDKRVPAKYRKIKYFIWVPWLSIIVILGVLAGSIQTIDPFFNTDYGISVTNIPMLIIYLAVVFGVLILSLTVGKRGFCHTACWMAPFMIMGTKIRNYFKKWPSYHLECISEKCKQCKKCDRICPMSLEVSKMVLDGCMDNVECIQCGTCVANCPQAAITTAWKWKKKTKTTELSQKIPIVVTIK